MNKFNVGDLVRYKQTPTIWRVVKHNPAGAPYVISPVFGLFGTNQLLANRSSSENEMSLVSIVELGNEYAALLNFIQSEVERE